MTRQVQESQQSQKDFIANVSHELKTPLTSIQGFARAIQDGTAHSPEELAQAADVIGMETARMHRLVQDLLTLTKLDAGTIAFSFKTMDLNLGMAVGRRPAQIHPPDGYRKHPV